MLNMDFLDLLSSFRSLQFFFFRSLRAHLILLDVVDVFLNNSGWKACVHSGNQMEVKNSMNFMAIS